MNSRERIKLEQFDYVTPTFDEIMADDFSYPEFIERCVDDIIAYRKGIKQGIFLGINEDEFLDELEKPDDRTEEEKSVSNYYVGLVSDVVKRYKKDYVNNSVGDDIYTPQMKKIAEEHLEVLNGLSSNVNETKAVDPFDILEKYRDNELDSIKAGSKDRALAYLNGEIGVRDLYLDDLEERVVNGGQSQKLLNIRRLVCASLPSSMIGDRKLNTCTIGELEPYMSRRRK